jgi:hypothetical protein
MTHWKDPVVRANLLACWLLILALLGLPLALLGIPGIPFLVLKPDPMSGAGGYEPFAMELTLMMQSRDNEFIARRLTPEVWKKVGGSKIRARVYARGLTAAPVLPAGQWAWILSERLNDGQSRLAEELEIPKSVSSVALSLRSHTPGRGDTWLLEPSR